MTESTTTDKPQKETATTPSNRTRSPGYPAFSLQTSLERARAVWEHEKRSPASTTALAAAWGLNVKSSSTLLSVSSLKKFGLLEDVDGGKERLLKLSQAALNIILNDQEDSPERIGLLKQCALTPQIHAELWKQYNGELPSDTNLRRHLIVEKNFNATSVDGFIKQFRDTISFAKLSPSDKITMVEPQESEQPQETLKNEPKIGNSLPPLGATPSLQEIIKGGWPSASPMSVLREFTFPLPAGVATLKIPFPIREEDFDMLLKTLNVFKEGMVKTEYPIVDCKNANWEQQAKSLAESQIEFNIENFDYTFNKDSMTKIVKDNNLNFRFYPNNGTGFIRKRPAPKLPAYATWSNNDSDKPVKIVAFMGERNGEQYYQSEDGTGIPASQLKF